MKAFVSPKVQIQASHDLFRRFLSTEVHSQNRSVFRILPFKSLCKISKTGWSQSSMEALERWHIKQTEIFGIKELSTGMGPLFIVTKFN